MATALRFDLYLKKDKMQKKYTFVLAAAQASWTIEGKSWSSALGVTCEHVVLILLNAFESIIDLFVCFFVIKCC